MQHWVLEPGSRNFESPYTKNAIFSSSVENVASVVETSVREAVEDPEGPLAAEGAEASKEPPQVQGGDYSKHRIHAKPAFKRDRSILRWNKSSIGYSPTDKAVIN